MKVKQKIAVIFGGQSAEHDVSIITAHIPIMQALQASNQFEIYPIYIAKDGSWYSTKEMIDLNYFKQKNLAEVISKEKKLQLKFDNGLHIIWPGLRLKSIKIDLVFPALHGTNGEDGSLMGLLRMANVPFVGCDLFASAVAMDKVLTKQVISTQNIPVVPYTWFTNTDWFENKSAVLKEIEDLSWPVFVKPVHLGSSIAISKVTRIEDLENAIEVALHYDDKVLVEESVENLIEVTLPIMGNDHLQTALVEKALNKNEFFDFGEKYLSGGKKTGGVNSQYSELPAKIDELLLEKVIDYGKRSYKVLGCTGIARIDFLINEKKKMVFVNEVNTMPGSLYHHNWKQAGISGVELVTKLITLAQERHTLRNKITYTFNSDILNHAGGSKISSSN